MEVRIVGDNLEIETEMVLVEPFLKRCKIGYTAYWHFIRDFHNAYKDCYTPSDELKESIKQKIEERKQIERLLTDPIDIEPYSSLFVNSEKQYNYQAKAVRYAVHQKRVLLADEVGLGKAQPLNSKILTPTGWKNMGDMSIGDEVVNPIDGGTQKVMGIYPQGKQAVFEVTFSDGSTARSTSDHLWAVQTSNDKFRNMGYRVKTLSYIKDNLTCCSNDRLQWQIPITKEISFNTKEVCIDPYLLGCLIGDGGLRSNCIYFSSKDEEIIEALKERLPNGVTFKKASEVDYRLSGSKGKKNQLLDFLRDLDLAGKKSNNKFIPHCYKFNNKTIRLNILQGLMDTDGYVSKDNVLQFTSVSEYLADDVKFIVESFGGSARKSSKIPTYSYNGEKKKGQKAYTLIISLPKGVEPFKLNRKLKLYNPREKYLPYRMIKSIEFVGEEECQCISLDTLTGLYLTNNCIVTHNTIIALTTALWLIEHGKVSKIFACVPANLLYQWLGECRRFINVDIFPDLELVVNNKTPRERHYAYRNFQETDNPIIMFTSYDTTHNDRQKISKLQIDMFIGDEASQLKNRSAKRSKTIKALSNDIEYMMLMNAVPIENGFEDLYSPSEILAPHRLHSKAFFEEQYCIMEKRRLWKQKIDIYKVVGYKNIPDAQEKLKGMYIRRTVDDVGIELPALITQTIELDLTDTQRKMYREILGEKKEDRGELTRKDLIGQFTMLHELCDSAELINPQVKASSKVTELKSLLEDDYKYTKVIIITEYKRMAGILMRELNKYQPLMISGDTKMADRPFIVKQFNENPNRNILIGTEAISKGQNLQVASLLINVDLPWNPAEIEQRRGRFHRLGSKHNTIRMINMVTRDTIESKIIDKLYEKGLLFEKMFKQDEDLRISNLLSMDESELKNFMKEENEVV